MLIGGLEKFSLIDYPHGTPSAVVFTIGCNFRCPFCHNAELVSGKGYSASSTLSFDDVVSFLESVKGYCKLLFLAVVSLYFRKIYLPA